MQFFRSYVWQKLEIAKLSFAKDSQQQFQPMLGSCMSLWQSKSLKNSTVIKGTKLQGTLLETFMMLHKYSQIEY